MSDTLALHDGRAGNARQALALARALDADADELVLQSGWPARWLAPRMWPGLPRPFGDAFRSVCDTPPAIAVGCGRQAALATRLLRRGGGKVVQLLDPRIDTRHWDLVVAPRHDGLSGDNVVSVLGSLHPVDDAWLTQARDAHPALATLPRPHTVLLVGGPSRHAALTDEGFRALVQGLAQRARDEGGGFSAVASRRTPAQWLKAIGQVDRQLPGIRWRGVRDGDNPYAGLLAHATRIVCTPDSVNMLSEAAATRLPVFAWARGLVSGRVRRFLDSLRDTGRVHDFDTVLAPFASEPLRETARVADVVRGRLGITRTD